MGKLETFQDLVVWQESHSLVLAIYTMTKSFPTEEKYGLTSQMRRAAVSVPANIAEGFKRKSRNEKVRFYNISQSSLEELKYYLILSKDLGYLTNLPAVMSQAQKVSRLLHRFVEVTESTKR
jgi:four helix bundle protein